MVDILEASGARRPQPGLAATPTSQISGERMVQPYTELAKALGAAGEALGDAAAPYHQAEGAKAVTKDADGNLQVQWRAEFTRGDKLYNAAARQAALASIKTDVSSELLQLRNDFDGRPAEFQAAAKEYVKNKGKAGDALLRPFIQDEADRQASQYFEGLVSAKHDLDMRNAFNSLVDRRKLVADNLEALAANGGTDTDEFKRARDEWKDLGAQLSANPKFAYNAEKDNFDTQRLDTRLKGESIASMTRRILGDQGVDAARKFVQGAFDDNTLAMDAKERRTYRNLAESVINERSKELATARREVQAEGREMLAGLKNGVEVDDQSFDDFLTRASQAGATNTVRQLVQTRAAKQQWKMFESLPTVDRVGFAKMAITGAGAPGMDRLVQAVMGQESSFNPLAESNKGASGLMQIMPGTARELAAGLGIRDLQGKSDEEVKAWLKANPQQNVQMGSAYLAQNLRRFGGDVQSALVAYNAGPGVAQEWIAAGKNDAVLPAETRDYKEKIMARLNMGAAPTGPIMFNGRQIAGRTTAEQIGTQYLGMSENDPGGRAAIKSFLKQYAGTDIDPAKVPWCAAFVNGIMGASGRKGSGSLRALDFLNYGQATDQPTAGDIVVFDWKDGSGHAGIVQGFEEKNGKRYIRVLGGNQGGTDDAGNRVSGTVSSSLFGLDNVAGYRKPPPVGGGPDFAQPRQFSIAGGARGYLYPDASMIDDYKRSMASDARRLMPSIADGFRKGLPPTGEEFNAFVDMVTLSGDQKLKTETISLVQSLEAAKQLEGLPKPMRDAAMQRLTQELSGGSSEVQRAMVDNLTESFGARDKALADDPIGAGQRYKMIPAQPPIDWANVGASLPARAKAANEMRQASGATEAVSPLTQAETLQLSQQLAQGDGQASGGLLSNLAALPPDQFGALLAQVPVRDALIGMTRSGDPAKMTAAFSALDAERRRDPEGFAKKFLSVEDRLEVWNAKMAFMPAESIAKEMQRVDDPAQQKARKSLRDDAEEKIKKITPSDVAGYFGNWVPFSAPGEPAAPLQAGELKADFEREFTGLYAEIGDEGKAREVAVERLKRVWAPSALNGGRLTKFAPERSPAFQPINGSFDWMKKQFDNDVQQALVGMGAAVTDPAGFAGGVPRQDVISGKSTALLNAERMVVPDARTQAEFSAGKPPSYPVVVKDPATGMYVPLQDAQGQQMRWVADQEMAMVPLRADAAATFERMKPIMAEQSRADERRRALLTRKKPD